MSADGTPGGAPDAGRLRAALAALGLDAAVEAQGALAVLVVRGTARLPDAACRAAVVAAAREAGFANVALELTPVEAAEA